MKIYVVVKTEEGSPSSVHSAHYSKWMAEVTVENLNKEIALANVGRMIWESYDVCETALLPEGA